MSVTERAPERSGARSLGIPGKYLSLTTYRRDGSAVSTPVWFVEDGGRLFVVTGAHSHKVRRLRRHPAATVAPCSARGVVKGRQIPVRVEFLRDAEHARVDRLMAEKYRVDRILVLPLYRLVTKLRGKSTGGDESAYLALIAA